MKDMNSHINIGDILTEQARLNPNKEAVYDVHADMRFSFQQINQRANRACNALQSLDIGLGDRVAVMTYNSHQFIESFFGPAKAGIVLVMLNWRLTAQELIFSLQDSGVKAIIYDADFANVVDQIHQSLKDESALQHWIEMGKKPATYALSYEALLAAQSDLEPKNKAQGGDNLFIMYTSGTTGTPKGVVHTHATQFWAVLTIVNTSDFHFSDRYLVLLPLFHVGALTPMVSCLYGCNSITTIRGFDPLQTWKLIEKEKISLTLAVPAMLILMLEVPDFEYFDWSSLRWILSGAAPLPVSIIEQYKKLAIEIHQVYGLTETCGPACLIGADDAMRKIGSTGKGFFHTQVRIIDADGNDQPPGRAGEILIKSGHIMKEYWNQPEATLEAITDGWLSTGDVAVQDEEGFITIQDRMKDMIISGGENVYPAEIENVLLQHPEVADAAVIGQESAKWGESPFAIIVKRSDTLTTPDLLTFCAGKLARFKLPCGVAFVNEIPRNASGKILKRALREQHPAKNQ